MKKRIHIALAALNFAHRVLTETGVVSKADARKQAVTFRCIEKPLIDMRERLEAIRHEYREEETMPNGSKRWIVKEEKRKEFEDKIIAIENEKVDVDFDIESLSVLTSAFNDLFTRQAALKEKGESNGIANETTMKLIEELDNALEGATNV